jgi:AcrR family transcriptional regulator
LSNPPPANRARPVKATWKDTRAAGMQLKRAAILDAASRTIMCSGPDAVSVSGIARELGMSNGVVYYYFANRDDLIWQCMRRAADGLDEALMLAETSAGTTLERLHIFMRAVLDADSPFAGALTPTLAWGLKDVLAKRARERYLMVRVRVARLLARGVDDCSITTSDPAVASDLLLAVLSRVHAPGVEASTAAIRSEALRFINHAVRGHAPAVSSQLDEMSARPRRNVA